MELTSFFCGIVTFLAGEAASPSFFSRIEVLAHCSPGTKPSDENHATQKQLPTMPYQLLVSLRLRGGSLGTRLLGGSFGLLHPRSSSSE